MSAYAEFLNSKRVLSTECGFDVPVSALNAMLFPFQRDICQWALRCGRAGIFSECGTGKTPMQLVWAQHVAQHTGRPVLILTPLAVAHQTVVEGRKFGVPVQQVRTFAEVQTGNGIYVTNYDRLNRFDASIFGGVVLDESSILKCYTGATKRAILEAFERTPYKLACTATPAPNDHLELGNHAQFLGAMDSNEMISRWFINDSMKAGNYRLKRHAEAEFWRWVSSWAISISRPSDLGYPDDGFTLPPLRIHEHIVYVDSTTNAGDQLFRASDLSATTLHQEMRLTAPERAIATASIVNGDSAPWIVWCHTDYEADELVARIPGAIEVRGSQSIEQKERGLDAFTDGSARVIITKPSIAGFGLNWQHCNRMAFVGLSYSYEQQYQAIRRSYRFGQLSPVDVHIISADTEGKVGEAVARKQREHDRMKEHMVQAVRSNQLKRTGRLELADLIHTEISMPAFLKQGEYVNATR